jgi:SWIM/SEC-C metal-binding protein
MGWIAEKICSFQMAKLGTKEKPAVIRVKTEERGLELLNYCNSKGWQVIIGIERDKPEDISDVIRLENPPVSATRTISIGRNDLCFCGSGKKYKHCCI